MNERFAVMAVSSVGFFLPFFFFARRSESSAVKTATSARWGIDDENVG